MMIDCFSHAEFHRCLCRFISITAANHMASKFLPTSLGPFTCIIQAGQVTFDSKLLGRSRLFQLLSKPLKKLLIHHIAFACGPSIRHGSFYTTSTGVPRLTRRLASTAAAQAATNKMVNFTAGVTPARTRREPHILTEKKASTHALRSVYLETAQSLHPVKSFNSLLTRRESKIDDEEAVLFARLPNDLTFFDHNGSKVTLETAADNGELAGPLSRTGAMSSKKPLVDSKPRPMLTL